MTDRWTTHNDRPVLINGDGVPIGWVSKWDRGDFGAIYRDVDGVHKLAGDCASEFEAKLLVEELAS